MQVCGEGPDSERCRVVVLAGGKAMESQLSKVLGGVADLQVLAPQEASSIAAPICDTIILDTALAEWRAAAARLRADAPRTPILLIVKQEKLPLYVQELLTWGSDFITTPIKGEELLARVRLLFRRSHGSEKPLRVGSITAHTESRAIVIGTTRIRLTSREFDLLMLFLKQPGRVVTSEDILRQLWERTSGQSNNLVPVYLNRLRAKLRSAGAEDEIRTMRGKGYVLGAETDTSFRQP